MKYWLNTCVALLLGIASLDMARGADLDVLYASPPTIVAAPFATWTGCFLGANMGILALRREFEERSPDTRTFSTAEQPWTGGLQAGCDYQAGPWVLGFQGNFNGTGAHGGASVQFPNVLGEAAFLKESYFATANARIGYTIQPAWLLYIKGGGAWAREFNTGWGVGGGLEWKLLPNLSLFIDYEYTRMDSDSRIFVTVPPVSVTSNLNLQSLLFGANWRFDWGTLATTHY
jgi:outer membrane immunogenic protein